MKRIVVGVDGSEGAHLALAWAAEEAERWGATLVAVHAWSMPVIAAPTGLAPMPVLPELDELAQAAKLVLDEALGEVRAAHPNLDIDPQVVEGPAGEALLEASEGADLVVVGTRGHGTVVGILLGSVSQHLCHHARGPVVLVPHPKAR
jgi:nucleotide-binding universal stress UspA family protein